VSLRQLRGRDTFTSATNPDPGFKAPDAAEDNRAPTGIL
jgi:hypothetical protein